MLRNPNTNHTTVEVAFARRDLLRDVTLPVAAAAAGLMMDIQERMQDVAWGKFLRFGFSFRAYDNDNTQSVLDGWSGYYPQGLGDGWSGYYLTLPYYPQGLG